MFQKRAGSAESTRLGYYPGNNPASIRRKGGKDDPIVVSATELKHLTNKIDGTGAKEKLHDFLKGDALARAQISKDRSSKWANTVAGQRRQKIEARQTRLAEEDAERQTQSEIYAAEEGQRIQESLDRAKRLQYVEKDEVRVLHSKIILFQVLKERDLQLALNSRRKNYQKVLDDKYIQSMNARSKKELEKEALDQVQIKEKKNALTQGLMKQIKEKQVVVIDEHQKHMDEGRRVRQLDANYRTQKNLKDLEKHTEQKKVYEMLVQMKEDVKTRTEKERAAEKIEEEKTRAWAANKEEQNLRKKKLEENMFEEFRRVRENIALKVRAQQNDLDSHMNESIEKAVQKKEEQEKLNGVIKEAKRLRVAEEMKRYFNMALMIKEEDKKIRKEVDKQELERCLVEAESYANGELQKKLKGREKAKELQVSHKQQMSTQAKLKQKLQSERERDEASRQGQNNDDERQLLEYVKEVCKEDWAKDNWRLQQYLEYHMNNPRKESYVDPEKLEETRARMGFIGGYSPTDFIKGDLTNIEC